MKVRKRNTAAALLFAAGLMVLVVPMAFAASVDPVQVGQKGDPQNPTCADFGLDAITKFDPVESGSQDGVTLTKVDDSTISWSSDDPIGAVIVKGGPGANVYFYDGATSDTGLVTPTNPKNGKPYGLSHVDFCAAEEPEPSETPSEEPSVLPSNTTNPTVDEPKEKDDDVEVLGERKTRGKLAKTGVEMWFFAIAGSGLMGSGLALRTIPRRKK